MFWTVHVFYVGQNDGLTIFTLSLLTFYWKCVNSALLLSYQYGFGTGILDALSNRWLRVPNIYKKQWHVPTNGFDEISSDVSSNCFCMTPYSGCTFFNGQRLNGTCITCIIAWPVYMYSKSDMRNIQPVITRETDSFMPSCIHFFFYSQLPVCSQLCLFCIYSYLFLLLIYQSMSNPELCWLYLPCIQACSVFIILF